MHHFLEYILLFLCKYRKTTISNVCINIHQYEIHNSNTGKSIKNSNHFHSFPYNFILKADIY